MCLAYKRLRKNICAKFRENLSKSEGGVHTSQHKICPNFLPIICHNHGNILKMGSVQKCVLHIYNRRHTYIPSFMEIGRKQDFPSFCPICELLPWQHFLSVKKMFCAALHPKTNIHYEFHENWLSIQEAVLP